MKNLVKRHSRKAKDSIKFICLNAIVLCLVIMSGCQGGSEKKTILRVWQTETDKDAVQILMGVADEFQKTNPNVVVQIESVSWNSLSEKLTVALRANNEPDLTHLEPFMVYTLVSRNLLLPIDDVIDSIETMNRDLIFPSIKDLQQFNGKRYGIAYAIGTTGFAYRKDIAEMLHLQIPKTWAEFILFCRAISSVQQGKFKVLLPGGDPFFIDQLFAELLANNGGKLFDPKTNFPLLNSRQVIETLEFLQNLSPYVDAGWQTQGYLDQFNRFGREEAGVVPVTYARASKAIENAVSASKNSNIQANPSYFAMLQQPTGPSFSGSKSISTIDCEPYVIFKSAENKKVGKSNNAEYAKKFLMLFYTKANYMKFVSKVPIHLTPIFQGMATSKDYLSLQTITNWNQWAMQTELFLKDPSRVRPIFMPDISEEGRTLPFLLDFQANRILSQAVADVVTGRRSPIVAANEAQEKATRLIENLGYKNW